MDKNRSNLKVIVGLGKTGLSCVRYLLGQRFTNLVVMDSRLNPPGLEELKRNFPSIQVSLGGFDEKILLEASTVIVSPGVALADLPVDKCLAKGIEIIGDIELFVRSTQAPIIAITGSNGKSTVSALLGEMIKTSGKKVGVGGNFGVPALELLDKKVDFYVLEMSSFQLETTKSLKAKAAVILNIFPDHMDRYESFSHYLFAKQCIYDGCEIAVVNRDDGRLYRDLKLPSKVVGFSSSKPRAGDFGINNGFLVYGSEKILPISELKIKGAHNALNALAAVALGFVCGLSFAGMVQSLRDFSGLVHRCQWLGKINDVDWYNDSKATNVGATIASIEGIGQGIDGDVILIIGGISKGDDFSLLNDLIKKYVKAVVLIGKDANLIEGSLILKGKDIFRASSMKEAVEISSKAASPQDAVLLSPACSSFDMFDNFEHRGEVFISEVNRL